MNLVKPVDSTNRTSKKSDFGKNALGAGVGIIAASQAQKLASATNSRLLDAMIKESRALNANERILINRAADNVLNQSTNLSKKGVKIVDAAKLSYDKPTKFGILRNTAKKGNNSFFFFKNKTPKWLKKYATFFKKETGQDLFNDVVGLNSMKHNNVYANRSKMSLSLFHELGHADNFNNSSFMKGIMKARTPLQSIAMMMPAVVALTKEEKPENGKELTKGQKIKNKLRKASPIVAALLMVPSLLDEGVASLKANKNAKEFLSSDLAKKVAKSNKIGFATYSVLTVVGAGLATWLAMKVKDSITSNQTFCGTNGTKIKAHQG